MMNEIQLRESIGVTTNQLIETNFGLVDIFKVENGIVFYGFLIGKGNVEQESVKCFLARFGK